MKKYRATSVACYIGYVTQALILTLPSLLFTVFYNSFGITLSELGIIITISFCIQIAMDISSAIFIDKYGYRPVSVFAHLTCFLGLLGLSVLPNLFNNNYLAVCLPIFLASVGGGLIEVIISPIMEELPNKKKSAAMSFLHSFFCWGQLGTALISTLYFYLFGIHNWTLVPLLWSVIPFINILLFIKVPLPAPKKEEKTMGMKELLTNKFFLLFLLLMLCSGAAEQSMSQWASLFAETGLGVSKSVGDLLGISLFAALMGISRLFYGLKSEKIKLSKFVLYSGILCIISYIITVFSPYPSLSLFGCALCGLSVGIMWPGTFSLASKSFPLGGTLMFALLAFFGDIGCAFGPGMVGFLSDTFKTAAIHVPFFSGDLTQQGLKFGLMFAAIFPVLLIITITYIINRKKRT